MKRSTETPVNDPPKLLRPSATERARALVERCAELLLEMAPARAAGA
jgi:hypothetical protein